MKKYSALIIKGKPTIYEIEVEIVTPLQDPSVGWLPLNEYRVRVLAPTLFHEKNSSGTLIPTILYSHSLFDSEENAVSWFKACLESTMKERAERHDEKFSEEALKSKLDEITVIKL